MKIPQLREAENDSRSSIGPARSLRAVKGSGLSGSSSVGMTLRGSAATTTRRSAARRKTPRSICGSWLRRHDCGEAIEPTRDLAASFFDRWLETTVKPRIRPRSFEVYKQAVDLHLLPEFGRRRLSDIRPIDLQSFYSKLRDRGLSATTIRTIQAIASNAFKQAVRWQMIRQNPAALVDLPRIEKREMQALTAAQARDFLKATEGDSYHSLFVFLLASGCRPGEAFGLKWSDIDWQAGTATIQLALYWKQGRQGWEITEPKTAKSRRTIPLGVASVKTLAEWKRLQAEARMRTGADWQNHDLVFTKTNGAPVDLDTLANRMKGALTAAGLSSSLRVYDLRHSCASILMAEGLNPKVVSERLGHANIALTLATYSHVSKGMQETASEKIENALFG